jgi:IclR helix-turn-helix domain
VLLWAIDFAGGAGLAPWQACLGRLATTPAEAREVLEDAVAGIDARERWLAQHGQENWEPSPIHPAVVVPVDELAELIDQVPDAVALLDTIARKGRKTAITLLVSTQRPTQDALGGGALRAQLTVRVCLRMNELRDGELVLGQGKKALGYRPDLLDAPGKLLIWDPPDHMRPIPAKAYRVDRARIPRTLTAAGLDAVPDLDPATADAIIAAAEQDDGTGPGRAAGPVPDRPHPPVPASSDTVPVLAPAGDGDPFAALLTCLRAAGPRGAKVAELAAATGRAKTWVHERLQDLHRQGQVERAGHGRWRLTNPSTHDDGGHDT